MPSWQKGYFQCKNVKLQNAGSIEESRFWAHYYTHLAKLDMRAHVSSHALTEFPPGVL
jgi:hypothetical protein